MPFQMQKLGFVTTTSVSAPFPNVGYVTAALYEDPTRRCRPRNRKLSSYTDVCVTDRHVVSNAKLGVVTTSNMSAE